MRRLALAAALLLFASFAGAYTLTVSVSPSGGDHVFYRLG